jgi:hypothetical protein
MLEFLNRKPELIELKEEENVENVKNVDSSNTDDD